MKFYEITELFDPRTPPHIIHDWLLDHGRDEVEIESLMDEIFNSFWHRIKVELDLNSKWEKKVNDWLVDVMEEVEADNEPHNLTNVKELFQRSTGRHSYKYNCEDNYQFVFEDFASELARDIQTDVLMELNYDPDESEKMADYWEDFELDILQDIYHHINSLDIPSHNNQN